MLRAVRHHVVVVLVCVALLGTAGYLYGGSKPATYTSSTRVLVNPSSGNPFSPTPASVRQDQATSLETEAQVARSAEVLGAVSAQVPALSVSRLERGVRVSVPANTQVIEIAFTAGDPVLAKEVTAAVADAYLANRTRRFEEVNKARIGKLENQTLKVVEDLRAATAAAQVGSAAKRSFNSQLADALRNELVGLRAQRTALENSETPAGAIISPASKAAKAGALMGMAAPVMGILGGLGLGCVIALLLERLFGKVWSADDVENAGLPVLAAISRPSGVANTLGWGGGENFDATIRRLRGRVLDLQPRPSVITVAPVGDGRCDAAVAEAVAESFAKAGLRVVLVRTEGGPTAKLGGGHLAIEADGLAEALLYERLNALDLLQPSVEPLLSLLPPGRVIGQSRDLLGADRLRTVLEPLVEAGHLVVVQSPGIESVEGEAIVGAADLGLVVVRVGGSRSRQLASVGSLLWNRGTTLAAVVVGHRGRGHGSTTRRLDEEQPRGTYLPVGHDLGERPLQVPPADVAR